MKKLCFDEVKLRFELAGCRLTAPNYTNAKTKMEFICVCGQTALISWDCFQRGVRCRNCRGDRISASKLLDICMIQNFFKSNGCELLENKYIGSGEPMRYRCKCGNISKIDWDHFKQGKRCQLCKNKTMSGSGNPRWNSDRNAVALNKLLRQRFSGLIWSSLRRTKGSKTTKSEKLLGYNWRNLKDHLLNHKNWNSVKHGKWCIDHIFPLQAFIEYNVLNPAIVNALDNLQPLERTENIRKGCKYNKTEFEKWLSTKPSYIKGTYQLAPEFAELIEDS